MPPSACGHSHGTGPHIQPGVAFSQRQLHNLQRVEGSKQQAPLQPTRTTTRPAGRPYACGLGLWNIFMLTRKQDTSQKQWDILLTTMISPIYLHQGPAKLGKASQGTHSNCNSQNCKAFKLNWKERWNRKGCDTPAQGQKQIPEHFQAKL